MSRFSIGARRYIFFFFILCFVFFLYSYALAVPHITKAKPEPVEKPGTHLKQRLAKKVPLGLFAPTAYPATIKVLFLRVEFQSDTDSQTTGTGLWSDSIYKFNGDSDFWVNRSKNSFTNYWSEVSYGLLNVQVDISANIYRLNNTISYYGDESYRSLENLIYESITLSDPDIDFSQYDAVLIVHAGTGEEADINSDTPNDIWSLYYSDACISPDNTGTNCLVVDGIQIQEAIIMPQTDSQDGIVVDPLGVYTHEFAHWLGLPDLYCTALMCLLDGVGQWSLMGNGIYNSNPALCSGSSCWWGSSPAHLDAWSKVYLGWVSPQTFSVLPDPGNKILNNVENNKEILRLQASSSTASEYFLIENRQLIGFDKGLPGHGLLIWLIDESVINSNINSNTINNNPYRPGVKLIEADGDFALLNYNDNDTGSAGDPFPGSTINMNLTPQTVPSSLPYTPYGWVNLKNISELSQAVSFNIGFSPLPPQNLAINLNTISWSQNAEQDFAYYKIYKNGTYLAQTTSNSYTDASAIVGDTYKVSAVDNNSNESVTLNLVMVTEVPNTSSSNSGGSGCFIATAAYGSYLDPHVMVLRDFRDRYLIADFKLQIADFKIEIPNVIGRSFVKLYYKYSPQIADYIRRHEFLKIATRSLLTPVVYGLKYPFFVWSFIIVSGYAIFRIRRCKRL